MCLTTLCHELCNKSSAVAEMGDRLATIHMSRKLGAVPLLGELEDPNVIQCGLGLRLPSPFPSNRHHQSNGGCLEGKRENYQVCSAQYCVQQLYTVNCTHMNRPNSSLDWVLSHWAHFTLLRFIFVYVLFCV